MDAIALVSPAMAAEVASQHNVYHIGHGIDPEIERLADPSPYGPGLHAVAVGSMLFDPMAIMVASPPFPKHLPRISRVTGACRIMATTHRVRRNAARARPCATSSTLRSASPRMLSRAVPTDPADSSLKLLQYDFFALPAICPHAIVGRYSSRFGYTPGDEESIARRDRWRVAGATSPPSRECLDWPKTGNRLLKPEHYPEFPALNAAAGMCHRLSGIFPFPVLKRGWSAGNLPARCTGGSRRTAVRQHWRTICPR